MYSQGINNSDYINNNKISELIHQQNLLNKLSEQLSNTFSNMSSYTQSNSNNNNKIETQKAHQRYFNNEEYEEVIYQQQDQLQQQQQQNMNQSIMNNSSIAQQSQNNLHKNSQKTINNQQNNNKNAQIKLFSTNLQSFGHLPLSSKTQSQQSLHSNNSQSHLNNQNKQQQAIYNNQSFANLQQQQQQHQNKNTHTNINFLSDNIKKNQNIIINDDNNTALSPLFSQKSTNLSVNSQQQKHNNNFGLINDSSIMQIDIEKIQNIVSLKTKGMLRQLYNELTLYPNQKQHLQQLLKDKPKFIKSLQNSMEGLLKVFIWLLDGVITQNEFTQIYNEWLRKRDISNCLINSSSVSSNYNLKDNQENGDFIIDEQVYMMDLLQKYIKDIYHIESSLPKILDTFSYELNQQLLTSNQLGIDNIGKQICPISQQWLEEAESLFKLLDDENRYVIDFDRIQYFLMALLLNEISTDNRDDMIVLVQKQTTAIMEHMFQTFGYIDIRNFKQYLLIQRLRRQEEIVTLKNNVKRIQKYWFKAKRSSINYCQYTVINLFLSKFPQTLLQSIVTALNDKEFELFILELNQKGFYSADYQSQTIEQNCQQTQKIVKFYVDQYFEIGIQHSQLDGTIVFQNKLEEFADKMFKKLINSNQGEISMVTRNISTFKQIFVKAIQEYTRLNSIAITDIIDQHLKIETENKEEFQNQNNNTIQYEQQISQRNNKNKINKSDIAESYQTQNSPPKKPNLSPINSFNKLAQEGFQQHLQVNNNKRLSQYQQRESQSINQQNLNISQLIQSPKVINSQFAKKNTQQSTFKQQSKQQSNFKNQNNSISQQLRNNSQTPVQQNQSQNINNNNLPTFSLNLSQLATSQQQNQGIQNQTQNSSNLMIQKSKQNHMNTKNSQNIYNDMNKNNQQQTQNQKYSHNSSLSSSHIPYASATANINNHLHNQSFTSQFSTSEINTQGANVNTIESQGNNRQNQQQMKIQMPKKSSADNITPVKMSLRQQIQQQQQVLDSMHKSPQYLQKQQQQFGMHNQPNLYQYSSQKNTNKRDSHSISMIVQNNKRSSQQYPQNVIMQTPLSAVPHVSTQNPNKRERSNSNNKIASIIQNRNIHQQNVNNLIHSHRSSGSSVNNVTQQQHRRSGQQPQQTTTPRTKTPSIVYNKKQQQQIIFNQHHNHSNSYQPLLQNGKQDQNIIGNLSNSGNDMIINQRRSSQNSHNLVLNNHGMLNNYNGNSSNKQSQQKSPTISISSKNTNTLSQQNQNVRSSGQLNEKSPIRSRRVENYDDVISRLMQFSVTNMKK